MGRRAALLIGVILIGAGWLGLDLLRRPPAPPPAGPDGIEFVVPEGYTLLEPGEATRSEAAGILRRALAKSDRVALRYTDAGDRIQVLADRAEDTLDEQVMGRNGTVQWTLWREGLQERLRWAENEGTFAAPDLPGPERRNPYH